MGQQRGGLKLRRSEKHAAKYQAQALKTLRNKRQAVERRVRRLKTMPKQEFMDGLGGRNANRVARRRIERARRAQPSVAIDPVVVEPSETKGT